MLIAHEVGHALFTPNKWDHLGSVPQSYVNVAEDIRIEKLMKRRYAGLPKTFRKGYEKFAAEDFFQLEGQDLRKFSLADRLNLFFKIGHFVDIPFTEEEEDYKLTGWDLETFEEVLQFAKDIYTYDKGQQEGQTSQTPSDDQPSQGDSNLPSDSQQDQSTKSLRTIHQKITKRGIRIVLSSQIHRVKTIHLKRMKQSNLLHEVVSIMKGTWKQKLILH